MCRCDYGICKQDCSCRCHIDRLTDLQKRFHTLQQEKGMINEAWVNALHKNEIVDMVDADGENRKAILQMVQDELDNMRKKPV